jgi:hypothetical protein
MGEDTLIKCSIIAGKGNLRLSLHLNILGENEPDGAIPPGPFMPREAESLQAVPGGVAFGREKA